MNFHLLEIEKLCGWFAEEKENILLNIIDCMCFSLLRVKLRKKGKSY
jgi:hypothetical protein